MGAALMDALERAGYRAHAGSPAFRRRLVAAYRVAAAHPDHAVSVSWGKDSVALLALAAAAKPRVVAVHGRYRVACENAGDIDRVRDAVLAREAMAGVVYREVEIPGEWDLFERAGGPFLVAASAAQKDALRWRRETARGRLRAAMEGLGCRGFLLGLRAAESRGRALNVAARGVSYEKRDGLAVALPLARWDSDDVWAYLVGKDLPWLSIYDVAPDRGRARSMLCIALGARGENLARGEYDVWRRAYPEMIWRWEERWPELRRLADCQLGVLGDAS